MKIRVVRMHKLSSLLRPFLPWFAIQILFGGDRASCFDEAVVAVEGDKFFGAASLAPSGEENSGQPTIVGLWVNPEFRLRGIGCALLTAAIERMLARNLTPVRVDVLSAKAKHIIDTLPDYLKSQLVVNDAGFYSDDQLDR